MGQRVAVLGAGSWGTAIARVAGEVGPTTLWCRSPETAALLIRDRVNDRYLPGASFPENLAVSSSITEAVLGASLVLVVIPSHGFRSVLSLVADHIAPGTPVISLTKGIEDGTCVRMSEIITELIPGAAVGVLSGPNLAHEVGVGQPAATVVAMKDQGLAEMVQQALHTDRFRVYTSNDVVGCEIAGATKNVVALAAGMADGLGFGENTRAALVTRGLAELGRMGIALGGDTLTFGGLAGVGDLMATCTSERSRNRSVGFALGRGEAISEIVDRMHMVAEGVKSAGPLIALAKRMGVEMPISEQVAHIVAGEISPSSAMLALMDRPAREEWDETLYRGLS
ncbi:MAG: NAD(P)-dependent glycerol-3-phosphate dehydrogenase, partial [Actinobacteria bacterium]|nr:NAD(P)-dependent glycerol-3-phosphate dehydrogenase [Actinomycetota bacterium]